MLKTFKDLLVWQNTHQFVLTIYKESNSFPSDELFGLSSQIRRTAVSVVANIAEGIRKKVKRKKFTFIQFRRLHLMKLDTTSFWQMI